MVTRTKIQLDPPTPTQYDNTIPPAVQKYLQDIYQRLGDGPFMARIYTASQLVGELAPDRWSDGTNYGAFIMVQEGSSIAPAYTDGINWRYARDDMVIV